MRKSITPEIAAEVKKLHKKGLTRVAISRQLGISYGSVQHIILGRYTVNVPPDGEYFEFGNTCMITGFRFDYAKDIRLK